MKKLWLLLPIVCALAVFLTIDPLHKRSKAGLKVEYQAGQASIFLNDQFVEKAPTTLTDLNSGNYILRITPDDPNLASFTTPLYLEKGTLTLVVYNPNSTAKTSSSTIFELKKLTNAQANQATIRFESYPENAFVSFDDQEVQFSPLEITTTPGDHHFSVTLPSYEEQNHTINLLAGYQTLVTISLAKVSSEAATEATPSPETTIIQDRYNQNILEASQSSEILGPKVRIKATGYFEGNQEGLNVRDAATTSATTIGLAKVGYYYPYIGNNQASESARLASDAGQLTSPLWYQIRYLNQTAWINGSYAELIEE